ncbi:hypothetical protein ACFYYB_20340 [Streptomyces sp. NPDC002886]|uniref:hypothetical protein n=1 Tax=Streptomyces sp. NPDC002886 TaxID=3364667 RepID=UPI0036A3ECBE
MITTPGSAGPGAFVRRALLYRDPPEYVAAVGGFVRASLVAGAPVLVAVPGPRLEVLRESLDGDADGVTWTDMTELGRNPGRILAALRDFAEGESDLPSPAYADAPEVSADRDRPLPEPEGDVPRLRYGHGDLAEVRAYAEGWTRGTGPGPGPARRSRPGRQRGGHGPHPAAPRGNAVRTAVT